MWYRRNVIADGLPTYGDISLLVHSLPTYGDISLLVHILPTYGDISLLVHILSIDKFFGASNSERLNRIHFALLKLLRSFSVT